MTNSFSVLYQDDQIIAVSKPTGMPVENDQSGAPSLFDAVRYRLAGQQVLCNSAGFLGIVHRIDRPVGGTVLFARTPDALRALHQLFRERKVEKRYWAIVSGTLPSDNGTLEGYLSQSRDANKSYIHDSPARGRKKSCLDYQVTGTSDNYTFVEIQLHTGRHHQIRAQLAAAGAPIKGDLKYGSRRSNQGGGIYLFARSLRFVHPISGETIAISAEPPADVLWDLFPRE